jgi:hypothetical protein
MWTRCIPASIRDGRRSRPVRCAAESSVGEWMECGGGRASCCGAGVGRGSSAARRAQEQSTVTHSFAQGSALYYAPHTRAWSAHCLPVPECSPHPPLLLPHAPDPGPAPACACRHSPSRERTPDNSQRCYMLRLVKWKTSGRAASLHRVMGGVLRKGLPRWVDIWAAGAE